DYFEDCYRQILVQLKEKTNAKIIILEQFLLAVSDKEYFRIDLDPKIQITRKLAREFADVFIPLDGLFAAASIDKSPTHWAEDGVHTSIHGSTFIAEHYLNAVEKLTKSR
ncbi:MAG: GDSL family lipase, partial [Oscillospiraceae bacterium]|nr:GDSL family lipase [Oscillospiraceae bacterium]